MSYARHLTGKSIWITGGAGYLGSALTRALDAEAAQVLCFDLDGRAEALVHEYNLKRTIPVTLDVNDPAKLPAAIDRLVTAHGLPDGVAHLAFSSSNGHRLEDLPAELFQATFDHTLTPTFVLCRALAEKMTARGSGNIVIFSSMYGVVAPDSRIYVEPMKPNPIDYGASKAALLQMTRYLAVHYGPANLRFNAITPGPFPPAAVQAAHPKFAADLRAKTALNRCGVNEEIVGPTLFLLSDSASYVTGHSLVVDGGWTSW